MHLLDDGHIHAVTFANCLAAFVVLMPSATILIEPTISASFLPLANSMPTLRLRLKSAGAGQDQVAQTGQPGQSELRPPMATARRVISAKPRVISAAVALCPRPMPSNTPAPIATTFLIEPPISTPIVSWLVYSRKVGPEKAVWMLLRQGRIFRRYYQCRRFEPRTSLAKVGPDITATRGSKLCPTTWRITSDIRSNVPFSSPLVALTKTWIRQERQHPLVQAAHQVRWHHAQYHRRRP